MAGVKVVLFDLDDTLFAHAEAVASGVAAHLAAEGLAVRDDSLATWMRLEELHYHRYLAGELGFDQQRAHRMIDFAATYGLTLDEPLEWFARYLAHYRAAWAIHDDVAACLDAMPGLRFGIITNGELAFQVPKLEAIGLLPRVEHVIASGQFGVAKPDPRIFLHACEVFGVAARDAAYVGDRFETDAVGAARAGLTGVWLDRRGAASADERREAAASGISIVTSLSEIPQLFAP